MLSEAAQIVRRAREEHSSPEAIAVLRDLSLDDFGLAMFDPGAYGLERLLPAMPAEDVQKTWMGSSGLRALNLSLTFMRTIESLNARVRGRPLHGAKIVDYGCGWGRLLRLALYYSGSDKVIGADAWDGSLAHAAGVPARLVKVDVRPSVLPFAGADFIYSFSVFTHLPEDVARTVLIALRKAVASDGMLAFTFCPIEQWEQVPSDWFTDCSREELKATHQSAGIAYHSGPARNAYGWTTISHRYLARMLEETGWKVAAFDRNLSDPLQEIVAATPA